jgi:hypothetical protein
MRKRIYQTDVYWLVALALLAAGCNFPGGEPPAPTQPPPEVIYTAAALTLQAQLTAAAPAATQAPPEQPPTQAGPPTETLAPPPSPTLGFTDTPAPTATSEAPTISASVNTNCRLGPSVVYDPPVGVLAIGAKARVAGRTTNNSWWYIENPGRPGQYCWVWGETTTVTGDTATLPFVTPPPPPPTKTPTATQGALFSAGFANVHACGGAPTAVFQVVNSGGSLLHSMNLKIELVSDGTVLFGPSSSDAPFMGASSECPPGGDTLPAGKTLYVGGAIGAGNAGKTARATIKLCTENGEKGVCATRTVEFTIP